MPEPDVRGLNVVQAAGRRTGWLQMFEPEGRDDGGTTGCGVHA